MSRVTSYTSRYPTARITHVPAHLTLWLAPVGGMANVNALDGSVEKEVKGEDMKLGATEGGYYTEKFDADHDDDGRSPRRSGAHGS